MSHAHPQRILVTGASGFVGHYLLSALRPQYPTASIFTTALHQPPAGREVPGASILMADMRNVDAVRSVISEVRPDLIFHLAGQASVAEAWADPAETLAINAGGAINLFEALRAFAPEARTLLVGSGEQYGPVPPEESPIPEQHPQHPINPYAVSKAAQELVGLQYAAAYGLDVVCVRAFNHFGPYQSAAFVIASFARQIAAAELELSPPRILVGNLSAQRDFLPVQDVVRAYLALAHSGRSGDVYNVGSGVPRAIADMLAMLVARANQDVQVIVDPARLRPVDAPLVYADISHLREDTGWHPACDFETALVETLNYWRAALRSV